MATLKDDYWTAENINLLIEKRITKDEIFKQTNSDKVGWLEVVGDMKKEGGSKGLNRINVRKQWFKICEMYKKSLEQNGENIQNNISSTPYYDKLCEYFEKNKSNCLKKCPNQENQDNIACKLSSLSYADRWSVERTNALIDARINRHSLFKGRGHAASTWKVITEDIIAFDEPDSIKITPQQVKKKWENLFTKYKAMYHTQIFDTNWPHFEKMHYFYTQVHNQTDKQCYESPDDTGIEAPMSFADRWPISRTKLLIERRIARAPMFGRGMSHNGWQAVLNDLIKLGAPDDLTVITVKKKWENLLTRHKIIKDSKSSDPKWPYFEQMEKYHNLKKIRHINNLEEPDPQVEKSERINLKSELIDKFMRCRLCQEMRGEHSLIDDKDLCNRIVECTGINVYDKIEIFPTKICVTCKTAINSFSEFHTKCHNTNKDLKDLLQLIVITTENNSKINKISAIQDTTEDIEDTTEEDQEDITEEDQEDTMEEVEDMTEDVEDVTEEAEDTTEEAEDTAEEAEDTTEEVEDTMDEMEDTMDEIEHAMEIIHDTIKEIEETPEEIQETFECSECPASFNSSELLESHLSSHKNVKYYCDICNMCFLKQSALFVHLGQHFEISKIDNILDLDSAELAFLEEQSELENINEENFLLSDTENSRINIPNDIFKCEICSTTYTSEIALKDHFDTHSRTEHCCPREDCNKKFTTLNSLRNHERRHLGLNSFLCTVCGKGFVTKNALKMHERIHKEKEHVCEICSKAFSVLSNLKAHQKKHHEGHRFYCSQCPKQFLTKCSLQRHELVHTGVKEFICDICSSAFFTLKELRKHKRYHENVRLYHCNECFKTFYEKHHLTIHMRCHTGERPYSCTIPGCNKSFKEKQKLQRHEKTPHRIV